jgi:hypothetical protein
MNVRKEIEKYSAEEDKQILLDLFDKYHFESQWSFVADAWFQRYGKFSYEVNRIWVPTKEGRILHKHLNEL